MGNNFRIVKIIDDYRVVINGGAEFFEQGDILEVYSVGEDVIDPYTDESLGTLDIIKAKLTVDILYEKMCLCTNKDVESPISSLTAANLAPSLFNATPKPLQVDLTQVSGGFDDIDMTIKIGDLVRKSL